jgi:hypothetical protein
MDHDHPQHDPAPANFWGSRYSIGMVVLGAVAGYFLLTEHRAHVFSALPFLLLAGCLLMHVFMHGGYGGHSHGQDPATGDRPPPPKTPGAGEQP